MTHVLITVQHLRFGGMEKVVAELAIGLAERGHEPTVVGMYPGGPFDEVLRKAGVEVHAGVVARGRDLRAARRLEELARGAEIAIAATGGAQHAPAVTLAVARKLGIPAARWTHGTPDAPLTGARHFVEGWMRRRNRAVVALTERHARALEECWGVPAEQPRVIPIGQDLPPATTPEARASVRGELGIGDDRFVVGLVAAFRPVKRHELLLRGAALLVPSLPELHVLLVGDGETRPASEGLAAELGIADRVTFTGARTDAPRLYAAMDVHALTSYPAETFPMCVVEAMAAGATPVATRVGGLPDIVADGSSGVLIEPESPEALATALLALARDPAERQRLSAAATGEAHRRFTRATMLDGFEELIRELLGASCVADDQRDAARRVHSAT